jgi:hypothetical protein
MSNGKPFPTSTLDVRRFAASDVVDQLDLLDDPGLFPPRSAAQAGALTRNANRLRDAVDQAARAGLTTPEHVVEGLARWIERHPLNVREMLQGALPTYADARLETLRAMRLVPGEPRRLNPAIRVRGGRVARGVES